MLDLAAMREELVATFGRPVDAAESDAVNNPFFRRALDHRRVSMPPELRDDAELAG